MSIDQRSIHELLRLEIHVTKHGLAAFKFRGQYASRSDAAPWYRARDMLSKTKIFRDNTAIAYPNLGYFPRCRLSGCVSLCIRLFFPQDHHELGHYPHGIDDFEGRWTCRDFHRVESQPLRVNNPRSYMTNLHSPNGPRAPEVVGILQERQCIPFHWLRTTRANPFTQTNVVQMCVSKSNGSNPAHNLHSATCPTCAGHPRSRQTPPFMRKAIVQVYLVPTAVPLPLAQRRVGAVEAPQNAVADALL